MNTKQPVCTSEKIFGYDWSDIQAMQQGVYKQKIIPAFDGRDYGCDPIGDGTFRMVPSGNILTLEQMKAYFGK